jgi:acyl-coenzyme A synthetase/AMP-(fatty) acid ligase
MTKTSTIVCITPLEIQRVTDGGSGHLIPGTKIKVIGTDGKPVSYDQPGELHVMAPKRMLVGWLYCHDSHLHRMYNSYLNNPQANKEV